MNQNLDLLKTLEDIRDGKQYPTPVWRDLLKRMDSCDLLDQLGQRRWRLDCQRDKPLWRVMYWCSECGLHRCVEESGAWHPSPREAIEAAMKADAKPEPEDRPEGRDGQANLPTPPSNQPCGQS